MPDAPKDSARPRRRASRKGRDVSGTIKVLPRGFGFVTVPSGPDVFVPSKLLKGVLDGDLVSVLVPDGDDAASRLEVLERVRFVAVADVESDGRHAVVDPAVGQWRLELAGRHQPHRAVLVRLSDGVVLEDLGDPLGDMAVARRMLERHRLPFERSPGAGSLPRAGRLPARRDLRDQLVVTVDADSSVDLDDALAVAAEPGGVLRVWVHIADVASAVLPGSVADADAAVCPTSVYLPQLVRHMLPSELAGDRLSLLPGVDRDVVTVELRLDPEGLVRSVDVYESLIRSSARLSYDTVGALLTGSTAGLADDVVQAVRQLNAAATRLQLSRLARGGVDASRVDPEPGSSPGSDAAHLLIERLMVAANEAVASWAHDRGLPIVYRVHDAPAGEQVTDLEAAANQMGLFAGLPDPLTPGAFAALAAQAASAGVQGLFWDATFNLVPPARYSTRFGAHFGLGSPGYCHFTSPLRRFADLLTHRMVKAYLAGRRDDLPYTPGELEQLASVCNDVAASASRAERDARAAMSLAGLKPRQVVPGVVVSVSGRAPRVRLESGAVGLLPRDASVRLGQSVRVRVRTVDPLLGLLEVALASEVAPRRSRRTA